MCQSYIRTCACGERTSELFFGKNVCNQSVVKELYCPRCSGGVDADPVASVTDNGWLLELDMEALREYAPQMAMDIRSLTADQVFDADYITWVGFTPEDNVDRNVERERIAKKHADDKRAHFLALREWASEREQRLAAEGWRKARRSLES